MPIPLEYFEDHAALRALRFHSRTELARNATLAHFRAGDYMFTAGQIGGDALFLRTGTVSVEDCDGLSLARVSASKRESRDGLAFRPPFAVSARCETDVSCIRIDATLLEIALTWDNGGKLEVGEVDEQTPAEGDWMLRLLQRRTIADLPAANVQAMFLGMQEIDARHDQIIIRQGSEGDYFYVIVEGRCKIIRESTAGPSILLAYFSPGDCFGEESLISGAPRNATVVAVGDCRLLRLDKASFRRLLNDPLSRPLGLDDATRRVGSGEARWLDVRLPSEVQSDGFAGSIGIPIYLLRLKIGELDRNVAYICVCDNSQRAQVAAYILKQHGMEAFVLDGGLASVGPARRSIE